MNFFKLLKALLCVVLFSVVSACSKDDDINAGGSGGTTPPINVPTVTERGYQLKEGSTVVDMPENSIFVRKDVEDDIKKYDEANNLIVFSNTDEVQKLGLKKGDILYSTTSTAQHPDGYCFRITDVTEKSASRAGEGEVQCTLENATILEAFDNLHEVQKPEFNNIKADNIIAFDVDKQWDTDWMLKASASWTTVTWNKGVASSDKFSFGVNDGAISIGKNKCKFTLDTKNKTIGLTYKIYEENDVTVTLGGTIKADFGPMTRKINYGKLEFSGDLTWSAIGKVKLESSSTTSILRDEEKKMAVVEKLRQRFTGKQIHLGSIDIPMPAGSQIIARPKIDVLAEIKVTLSGEVEVEFGLRDGVVHYQFANTKAWGAEMEKPIVKPITDPAKVFTVTGKLEGKAYVGMPMGVSVEIPGLKTVKPLSSDYPKANTWSELAAREKVASYFGFYFNPHFDFDVSLNAKYDATLNAGKVEMVVNPAIVLGLKAQWLLGLKRTTFTSGEFPLDVFKWNFGEYKWSITDQNNGVYLQQPVDKSVIDENSSKIPLKWISTFGSNDKVTYTIYVGGNPDREKMKAVASVQDQYTYDYTPMANGTVYWYVNAKTASGMSYDTDIWSFTVRGADVFTVRTIKFDDISFNMVLVKGGTFTMGASKDDKEAYEDERPAHRVTLTNDYYIGETEVTQALWKAVMGSNPSKYIGDNKPVESITWNDAVNFINKLNTKTKMHFRLPTEAEWEFAARGGNNSKGYKYSGSNVLKDVAWFYGNCGGTTHEVATKAPNELGIYDMAGNVCEWCSDWYGNYSSADQTNPSGPQSGYTRICRNSSFNYVESDYRTVFRGDYYSTNKNAIRGLRLAL